MKPHAITPRQLLYKRYRLQGLSKFSAAIKAGYSEKTASCGKIRKSLDFKTCLEIEGITSKFLASKLHDGLHSEDGYLVHKNVETILKVRGDLTPQNMQGITQTQINVYLPELPSPSAARLPA